jgi:hypothetical protein
MWIKAYDAAGRPQVLQVCFMLAMQYGGMCLIPVSGWLGHHRRGARCAGQEGGSTPCRRAVMAIGRTHQVIPAVTAHPIHVRTQAQARACIFGHFFCVQL